MRGDQAEKDRDIAIGQRLTAMRRAAGVSQEKLGEALGVTFQQVQKYERGKNRLGVRQLETVTSTLACSTADIVGPMAPANPETQAVMTFMVQREGFEIASAYMAMSTTRRVVILGLIRDLAQ